MELSVIIVNYRTAGLVLDCLETVYKETPGFDFEVFVVDNASNDGSRQRILSVYPGVRWLQMDYNAGFARANNAAIRIAEGKAILLLNPDTLIGDEAIKKCYEQFAVSDYVACGVQLLNADRTPQITGSYFMKGGLNYLLPLPFLGNWIKTAGNLFGVAKPHVRDAGATAGTTVEVDWINGAFLMVKRNVLQTAGLLDEDFFLYAEEIEWCSRLRRQGRIAVYGQLHVIHLQGASANETFGSEGKGYYNLYDCKGLQIMLSNFVRIRKQFGIGWFLVQVLFYVLEIPVFLTGLALTPKRPRPYSFAQFRQYCKNIGVVIRLSFIILRNKPYFYKVL